MHIRNIYVNLVYKALFIILCAWGLYLELGMASGQVKWYTFNYYTVISNVVCLLFFICAFVAGLRRAACREQEAGWQEAGCGKAVWRGKRAAPQAATFAPRLKGAVVMCITITLLIYQFVLVPTPFSMGSGSSIANMFVHLIVPVMVIFDWLLFDTKGNYKKLDPLLWLITPAVYLIYIIIRAQYFGVISGTDSKFPYRFIDVDAFGWGQVLRSVAEIAFTFIVIGYLFYFIDKWLRKR